MCIRDRDKVAPGTANDDTLLYGVEVKFYNMEVEIDKNLDYLLYTSTSSRQNIKKKSVLNSRQIQRNS